MVKADNNWLLVLTFTFVLWPGEIDFLFQALNCFLSDNIWPDLRKKGLVPVHCSGEGEEGTLGCIGAQKKLSSDQHKYIENNKDKDNYNDNDQQKDNDKEGEEGAVGYICAQKKLSSALIVAAVSIGIGRSNFDVHSCCCFKKIICRGPTERREGRDAWLPFCVTNLPHPSKHKEITPPLYFLVFSCISQYFLAFLPHKPPPSWRAQSSWPNYTSIVFPSISE